MKFDREAARQKRADWATRHGLDPAKIIDEAPDVTRTQDGTCTYTFREVLSHGPLEWREILVVSSEPFPSMIDFAESGQQ